MLLINSKEFRSHVGEYFDKVDQGEHIVIQRGREGSYVLVPVTENGVGLTPAMIEELNSYVETIKLEKSKKPKVKVSRRRVKELADPDDDLYMPTF